jgi:hypothetical protein
MGNIRAQVKNGRLIVDEPTDLPEGTVLDLVVDDEGDDLDADERAALDEALAKSVDQVKQGMTHPVSEVLRQLRDRR